MVSSTFISTSKSTDPLALCCTIAFDALDPALAVSAPPLPPPPAPLTPDAALSERELVSAAAAAAAAAGALPLGPALPLRAADPAEAEEGWGGSLAELGPEAGASSPLAAEEEVFEPQRLAQASLVLFMKSLVQSWCRGARREQGEGRGEGCVGSRAREGRGVCREQGEGRGGVCVGDRPRGGAQEKGMRF